MATPASPLLQKTFPLDSEILGPGVFPALDADTQATNASIDVILRVISQIEFQ